MADAHAPAAHHELEIPYNVHPRPDTGLYNAKFGIWLFLASEVMLFGALFSTYILLRSSAPAWPRGWTFLNVPLATVNTFVLILSSVTVVMAWSYLRLGDLKKGRIFIALTLLCAVGFLVIKGFEYTHEFQEGRSPATNNFMAIYFTLTGLHGCTSSAAWSCSHTSSSSATRCGRRSGSGTPIASKWSGCTGTSSIWCGSFFSPASI